MGTNISDQERTELLAQGAAAERRNIMDNINAERNANAASVSPAAANAAVMGITAENGWNTAKDIALGIGALAGLGSAIYLSVKAFSASE